MQRVCLIAVLLTVGGCDRPAADPPAPPDDPTPAVGSWQTLECRADIDSIDQALGERVDVPLTAFALPPGAAPGEEVEVTADGWWTVLSGGGTVDSGLYTSPDDRGGVAVVEVQLDGLAATCEIEIHLRIWLDLAETELSLDEVRDRERETNDACASVVLYPHRDASFPPNQFPPLFQWLPAWYDDVYFVELETPYVHVLVSTPNLTWQPDFPLLRTISRSHDDARTDLVLQILSAEFDHQSKEWGSGLCVATRPTDMEVSDVLLRGSVIYWSPATEGLWSIEIGADDAGPLLDRNNTGGCVGCHSVNPGAPERMAMSWGGDPVVSEVRDLSNPIFEPDEERQGTFTVLDGTGERLIRSWGGSLFQDDVTTGEVLGELPTEGYATHPTMSAEGDKLVYSSCDVGLGNDEAMYGCGLRYLSTDDDGALTIDQPLVERDPTWNYYYPSISPDGRWVVFNRSTGDTEDDEDAELMLISLVLEGDPIRLDRANGGLYRTNSWPRWGSMGDERAWLSFSSRRGYGTREDGPPQVWLSELDLALAYSGFDPSRSAIRLPGQDPETGNHTPVWLPRGAGL